MQREWITQDSMSYCSAGLPMARHHMLPFCLMSLCTIPTFSSSHFCQWNELLVVVVFRSNLQARAVYFFSAWFQIKQILPLQPLKMTCLLLKAFKWSSVLANYQVHCLVARETHTRGFSSLPFFFFSLPRGSCFKTVSNLVHSHCCLSAKSFLCCSWSRMEGKRERMGVVRGKGRENKGPLSPLPRQLDVTVTSRSIKSF